MQFTNSNAIEHLEFGKIERKEKQKKKEKSALPALGSNNTRPITSLHCAAHFASALTRAAGAHRQGIVAGHTLACARIPCLFDVQARVAVLLSSRCD